MKNRKITAFIMIAAFILGLFSSLSFTASAARADELTFSDVTDPSSPIYRPIYWAAGEGIAKGFSDGTFRPVESCTREQFVTFIWRMNGKPDPASEESAFPDVDSKRVTFRPIGWAVEGGIIKGYDDGTFRPEETLLRQHVAIMLWRMAGKPEAESGENPFSDITEETPGYDAILWGAEAGLIHGYADGTFRPEELCQRQHVAIFLYRYDRWEEERHEEEYDGRKVVYLTFDDGPSVHTERLLDILDAYDVKVTFFVTGAFPDYRYNLTREAESGHAVAVHTYTHDYSQVYAYDQAYWDDFNRMNDVVEAYTGKRADFFRFPGGSSNEVSFNYNYGIMSRLTDQALAMGLQYYDWNAGGIDAGGSTDSWEIAMNAINNIDNADVPVVLLHDTHGYTVDAVPTIIEYCLSQGYVFRPLTKDSTVCHHSVAN